MNMMLLLGLQILLLSRWAFCLQMEYVVEPFETTEHLRFWSENVEGAFFNRSHNETYEGNGALVIHSSIDHSTPLLVGSTTNVTSESPHNCLGGSDISFLFKVVNSSQANDPDFTLQLLLLDESECEDPQACPVEEMRHFAHMFKPGRSAPGDWSEVKIPLNDTSVWQLVNDPSGKTRELNLGHIRGWFVGFGLQPTSIMTVEFDYLACIGSGSLFGAPFALDTTFSQALATNYFRTNFYESESSMLTTNFTNVDNTLRMDYQVEKTADWGGFSSFSFVAPAAAYYNLSRATAVSFAHEVHHPASVPERVHLRMILLDVSSCETRGCQDDDNFESFYSFFYVLDRKEGLSFESIELRGDGESTSPFWNPGWGGNIGNGQLDKALIKGILFEISLDRVLDKGSNVTGSLSFSQVAADVFDHGSRDNPAKCIREPGMLVTSLKSDDNFDQAYYRNDCCDRCLETENCLFGLVDEKGQDCAMSTFLDPLEVTLPDTQLQVEAERFFWVDDTLRRGDFCTLCDCLQSKYTIDCKGKDLAFLPATFTSNATWDPIALDLRENPRLSFIGTGSLSLLPETIEEIRLPDAVRYIAFEALDGLLSLKRIKFEGSSLSNSITNVITSAGEHFGSTCCEIGRTLELDSGELSFCEKALDTFGSDTLFQPFIRIRGPEVIETLRPSSPFMSEATESPEKCAAYCQSRDDCYQFNYDGRSSRAEPVCAFLGPPTDADEEQYACCLDEDFADEARTVPGYVSGKTPRTRHQFFGATVNFEPKQIVTSPANNYTSEFHVSLGAMPLRGAVWVTPRVLSASNLDVVFSPASVALLDNATVATIRVLAQRGSFLRGSNENIVIFTEIESCDSAFAFVSSEESRHIQLAVQIGFGGVWTATLLVAVFALSLFSFSVVLFYQKSKRARELWVIEPEELEFSDDDNFFEDGSFGRIRVAEYRGTTVMVKPVLAQTDAAGQPLAVDSGLIDKVRLLSILRHRCLAKVLGTVINEHPPRLVMEFSEYESLRDIFVNKHVTISDELQLNVLKDVADGMQFLHACNPVLLHGDLRGANVLVTRDLRAKLTCYGLGWMGAASNTPVGSSFWRPPECLRCETMNTVHSDVYSFGVLVYEVFARKDPYDGEEEAEVIREIVDPEINKRPAIPKGCPIKVAMLMNDCLSRDPENRPDFAEISGRTKRLSSELNSTPTAELHMETTIVCMEVDGFTSWSSARNPAQSVMLLEAVHSEFNRIAKKLRIHIVDTVGDTFAFIAGIGPDPCPEHAVVVIKFACLCVQRLRKLTKTLEPTLGPDTTLLKLQIGLASGPVTGGVLRNDKSRYQVFGTTMKTALVLVATGGSEMMHISQATGDSLTEHGKSEWIVPRSDKVGHLSTYWVSLASVETLRSPDSSEWSDCGFDTDENGDGVASHCRLIQWNVTQLEKLLMKIVARRDATSSECAKADRLCKIEKKGHAVLSEVCEIITLPGFDKSAAKETTEVDLPESTRLQLHDFVSIIAGMYTSNHFHCFEHASHVVMSVIKLLGRIVAPINLAEKASSLDRISVTLHDHTYGITSDPLTQFACLLVALIHDADHPGVPNPQLAKEQPMLAAKYENRSIAEQNSFDLAWDTLMDDRFSLLRETLCSTQDELVRFRKLVVNGILATDISDKEMKKLRDARWTKAFGGQHDDSSVRDSVNRKATIVIEHLIQASDVAHTMQHWHIYRTWNERLFNEMYVAYKNGRAEKHPREFWYKGEIGFFDFYIIPLAKKLKKCGVFGVSSDEYLDFAQQNRKMWEDQGQSLVEEMILRAEAAEKRVVLDNTEQEVESRKVQI